MPDPLSDSLRIDLGCDAPGAAQLAALARVRLPRITGTAEDSDEDLVVRLRDPRVFGEFAATLLADGSIAPSLGDLLAERLFDLLPLPGGEGDVIVVESRAPRRLLAIAAYLGQRGGLTVLHVMHLVFAVFLDRAVVAQADRRTRSAVLDHVLHRAEANPSVRALYAAMHLASVPETEAHREFRRILRTRAVDEATIFLLARAAASEDGGLESFLRVAQDEGLVSWEWTDSSAPGVVVNIPQLPARLRALGRRWLEAHR